MDYYIIKYEALPKSIRGVIAAQKLLDSGEVETVHEACKQSGIGRTTYYEYKDMIRIYKNNN